MPAPLFLLMAASGASGYSAGTIGGTVVAGGTTVVAALAAWWYFKGEQKSEQTPDTAFDAQARQAQEDLSTAKTKIQSLHLEVEQLLKALELASSQREIKTQELDEVGSELKQTQQKLHDALQQVIQSEERLSASQQQFKHLSEQFDVKAEGSMQIMKVLHVSLDSKDMQLEQTQLELSRLNILLLEQGQTIVALNQSVNELMNTNQELEHHLGAYKNKVEKLEPQISLLTQKNLFFCNVIAKNIPGLGELSSPNSQQTKNYS